MFVRRLKPKTMFFLQFLIVFEIQLEPILGQQEAILGQRGAILAQHETSLVNFKQSRNHFWAILSQGGPILRSRAKNIDFCKVFTSSRIENVVFLQFSEGPRILGTRPGEAQRIVLRSPPSRALTIKTKENWKFSNFDKLFTIKRNPNNQTSKTHPRSRVAPQGCRRISRQLPKKCKLLVI